VFTETSRGRALSLLTVILMVTISQSTIFAEEGEQDYPASISLEITDGIKIYDISIISGTIRDERPLDSVSWELLDSSGTRQFLDLTDDLVIESDIGSRSEWSFDVEIIPIEIGPCACINLITVIDEYGISHISVMSIFISPNIQQLPPTLHFSDEYVDTWSSHVHRVNAISMTVSGEDPIVEYVFRNSSTVKCSDDVLLTERIALDYSQISFARDNERTTIGELSFEIDLTGFSDGWYDIFLFAINPSNQEFSRNCISIRVDNTAPLVLIEGPSIIPEGYGVVVIDGSSSFDHIWGIQGLTYIWSVFDINGGPVADEIISQGTDVRSISIYPNSSGIYEVILTIVDQANNIGHSSHIIEVQNIPPLARLSIDGVPIYDNESFTLSRDNSCLIDASESIDSPNDVENLRYIWRVNNIPTYVGESRDFSWPEGIDDDFILTIEVIDDNSESSMISIMVRDSDVNSRLPFTIVVFIFSSVFLTYSIINFRIKNTDSDIPKWS